MTQFRVDVVVDPTKAVSGAKQVERSLGAVENRADQLRVTLGRALAAVGVAVSVRQVIELADTYTTLQNRLRNVVEDTDQLAAVTQRLLRISNETRGSFEANVTLYQRLANATKQLGLDQEELFGLVQDINRAFAVSGVGASEAAAALRQLSQGLASGTLRGDEFVSVAEQAPIILDLIAKEAGKTRGELREFAAQGGVTADLVVRAFRNASDELRGQFGSSVATVGQAMQVLRNNFIAFVGELDQGTGATRKLADGILFLSEHIEQVVLAVETLAVAIGTTLAIKAFGALRIAIMSNPFGALVVALAALVPLIDSATKEGGLLSDAFNKLVDGSDALNDNLRETSEIIKGLGQKDLDRLGIIIDQFGRLQTRVTKVPRPQIDVDVPEPPMPGEGLGAVLDNVVGAADRLGAAIREKVESSLRAAVGAARDLERALAVGAAVGELEDERAVLQALVEGRRDLAEALRIEQALRQQGVALEPKERERLVNEVAANQALRDRFNAQQQLVGQQEEINRLVAAYNALLQEQPALAAQAARAIDELRLAGLQSATDLGAGFERAFLRMRLEASDFASAAEAAVGAFADTATNALVEFAETGKFSFEDFARSLLSDLTRIIARLLVVQALSALGGATGIIPPIAGGRQHGGTVQPGHSYVVGENGPELFEPGRTGTIVPNPKDAPAPVVENKTQVVVVADPDEVPQAIASGAADEQIIVAIQRNRDRVRQVIS